MILYYVQRDKKRWHDSNAFTNPILGHAATKSTTEHFYTYAVHFTAAHTLPKRPNFTNRTKLYFCIWLYPSVLDINYVDIQAGNSWEKIINHRFSGSNVTCVFATPVQCSDHWVTGVANKSKRNYCILGW